MNWKLSLLVALVVLPLVALLAFGFGRDPREVPFVLAGKPAPAFSLQRADGEGTVSLAELRGKPLLINFWSTWCIPCKSEHAALLQAARFYKGRVNFLGIIYQDSADAVRAQLKRAGSAYPHVLDPDSSVAIDYGVAGVPESFFIDAKGNIRAKQAGALTASMLHEGLDALLADAESGS